VSNIAVNLDVYNGHPGVALAWGVVSFAFAVGVLALDRSQFLVDRGYDFMRARDGRVEGYSLLSLVAYWIVGVAFTTQVDGLGYLTLNIYFSTWLVLFASAYTLNEWSTARDILSVAELTSLSATLKSWYVLFLSSLVVFGTTINCMASLYTNYSEAALGFVVSLASAVMSLLWICVHCKFVDSARVAHGGWLELGSAAALVVLWIAATAVITQDGGLGSTIVGVGCNLEAIYTGSSPGRKPKIDNCTIAVQVYNVTDATNSTNRTSDVKSCLDFLDYEIPGSNLYVFTWLSLASAFHVCFRWKAQQALMFAQARGQRAAAATAAGGGSSTEPASQQGDSEEDFEDDDDDLDDFEDTAAY